MEPCRPAVWLLSILWGKQHPIWRTRCECHELVLFWSSSWSKFSCYLGSVQLPFNPSMCLWVHIGSELTVYFGGLTLPVVPNQANGNGSKPTGRPEGTRMKKEQLCSLQMDGAQWGRESLNFTPSVVNMFDLLRWFILLEASRTPKTEWKPCQDGLGWDRREGRFQASELRLEEQHWGGWAIRSRVGSWLGQTKDLRSLFGSYYLLLILYVMFMLYFEFLKFSFKQMLFFLDALPHPAANGATTMLNVLA